MAEDSELSAFVGTVVSTTKVVIERGPVSFFATAVIDDNPVFSDPRAANEAGFSTIPAPPTFPFVMETFGAFPELQPHDAPTGGLGPILGKLMAHGGLILHGEQAFTYHRPVHVGDVLNGVGVVTDAYAKESKGKTMTFVVVETTWTEADTGAPVVTSRFNVIHRK